MTTPITPSLSGPVPTVNGRKLTVDMMVKQPEIFYRGVRDLFAANFWADKLLADGGAIAGNAVAFTPVENGDAFMDRDVEELAENAEVPLLTSSGSEPVMARTRPIGGGVYITDDAVETNNVADALREQRRLANTMLRKVHGFTVQTVNEALTASNRSTQTGTDWRGVVANGAGATSYSLWPHADITNAQAAADVAETGIVYDTLVVNPLVRSVLVTLYEGDLSRVFAEGVGQVLTSNMVAQDECILAAGGQMGQIRWGKGIGTEQIPERRLLRTIYQTVGKPLMYVDQVQAGIKLKFW